MMLRALFCVFPGLALGAVVPFTFQGGLESAQASSNEFNTGGSVVVNGASITIPKNLQVQLPAAFLPFKDVASGGHIGSEVSVTGNYVDGQAIAGLFSMSPFLLEANSGVIKSLGFDGKITMEHGQVIRINDPNAVYSAGYTSRPEYTADDENPSITAFSGFPMCVPRSANDPKCPSSNRPAGRTSFTVPDPLIMAPLMPGDYIEYSGVKVGGEVICYSLVAASVQILTTGAPTYIRVEDALIGVRDGSAGTEFADTRFIGYTSDASVSLLIHRSEVDPCTGKINDFVVGSASPKAGDIRNKWTWRADAAAITKYTRDYHITASTGTKETNGGQIKAGQYVQPVGEWIFPESTTPGAVPPPIDFSAFTHLANGAGPDDDGNIWGQLSPWPGANPPAAPGKCTAPPSTPSDTPSGTSSTAVPTSTPIANAGPDAAVRPGVPVTLRAISDDSEASFPPGDLSYEWLQTSGPTIKLEGATSKNASFTAPKVTALTKCEFSLSVTSKSNTLYSTDKVVITNDPAIKDVVTIDSYTWTTTKSGSISVTAHSNVIDGSATLRLVLNSPNPGASIAMVSQGGGKWSYDARSTKQPSNGVTVTSNFGGTGSRVIVTS